jgi:hypothetical protein
VQGVFGRDQTRSIFDDAPDPGNFVTFGRGAQDHVALSLGGNGVLSHWRPEQGPRPPGPQRDSEVSSIQGVIDRANRAPGPNGARLHPRDVRVGRLPQA